MTYKAQNDIVYTEQRDSPQGSTQTEVIAVEPVKLDLASNDGRYEAYKVSYINCGFEEEKEDPFISWIAVEREDQEDVEGENCSDGLVYNEYDVAIDYETAVNMIDDDLREEIHGKLAPCTDQEFFDEYAKRHEEKFGEIWELAKENPCY